MQGDLISRSELLKALETWGGDVEVLAQYIKDTPTAYSVESVVEQLEELAEEVADYKEDDIFFGEYRAYLKAIEIVKAGGTDEQTN